jgi:hypothetical protein
MALSAGAATSDESDERLRRAQASTPPTTTTTATTAMMRLRVARRCAASALRVACRSALARATSRLRLLDVTVALPFAVIQVDA